MCPLAFQVSDEVIEPPAQLKDEDYLLLDSATPVKYYFAGRDRPNMTSHNFGQFLAPSSHRHAFYCYCLSSVVTRSLNSSVVTSFMDDLWSLIYITFYFGNGITWRDFHLCFQAYLDVFNFRHRPIYPPIVRIIAGAKKAPPPEKKVNVIEGCIPFETRSEPTKDLMGRCVQV